MVAMQKNTDIICFVTDESIRKRMSMIYINRAQMDKPTPVNHKKKQTNKTTSDYTHSTKQTRMWLGV
jgi:hypothetical protein